MSGLIKAVNSRLVPALALDRADENWLRTIRGSILVRPVLGLTDSLTKSLSHLSGVGTMMQQISFGLVAILCLILAAPQFANDKEGLALIIAAAFGLRLLGTFLNGAEKYKPSAVDAIVLMYFAINIIASFASHYFKDSLFGLAKLTVYVVAYFLFVASLQTQNKKRSLIILLALVIGGTLVSIYGLYQFKIGVAPLATWEDPTVEEKTTRVFSTLGNPNFLAGYLIPLVPMSLCLAVMAFFNKGLGKLAGIPVLGMCAIITVATVLTGSRGGFIGLFVLGTALFVTAFLWLWTEQPKFRIGMVGGAVILPILAAAVVHFALPSVENRAASIFKGSEHSSNAYRLNVYRASGNMVKDNWWLGIGPGNKTFRLAYGLYMRSGFDALGTYSVPLEVAVETGLPGLFIFLWLLVATLSRAHLRFWETKDPVTRLIAISAASGILGMMAHGLFDTVFYRPQVQFIFWLAVSLIVALPSTGKTSETSDTVTV